MINNSYPQDTRQLYLEMIFKDLKEYPEVEFEVKDIDVPFCEFNLLLMKTLTLFHVMKQQNLQPLILLLDIF